MKTSKSISSKIIKEIGNTVYFESLPIYKISCYFIYNILKHSNTQDTKILELAIRELKPEQKINFALYLNKYSQVQDNTRYGNLEEVYEIRNIFLDISSSNLKINMSKLKEKILRYIKINIDDLLGKKISSPELNKLERVLKLSYQETLVVLFIYIINENDSFNSIFRFLSFKEIVKLIQIAAEIPANEINSIFSSNSKLFKAGIIDFIGGQGLMLSLNESIEYLLAGFNEDRILDDLYRIYEDALFDIKSFGVSKLDLEILISMIKSNQKCNILFYGEPGTGKTEFSKSLIKYCRKRAIFVNHSKRRSRYSDKMLAFEAAMGIAGKKDVIVVDEADSVLASKYDNIFGFQNYYSKTSAKAWINDFIDSSNKQIIWITNKIEQIDKSTLRRFVYSLEFKPFTRKERETAWKIALKNTGFNDLISKREIMDFSVKYPLSMGPISFSLNALNYIKNTKRLSRDKAIEYLKKILASQTKLLIGERREIESIKRTMNYDLSILNTDVDIKSFIKKLQEFKKYSDIYGNGGTPGLNILFYGVPGTGKTEFAKYVSKKLNKKLIIKRASDILSMFVGGTEQNINSAFRQAEEKDAILLIDEADSFFIERKNAIRSWEISQTNELLTQMENHSIIFIACTNLLENLDNASLRRFHWKIRFEPLTENGKLKLYRRYFNLKGKKLTEKEKKSLLKIEMLTPGDIRAVWQRLMFLGPNSITHSEIIDELKKEVRIKIMKEPRKVGLV